MTNHITNISEDEINEYCAEHPCSIQEARRAIIRQRCLIRAYALDDADARDILDAIIMELL